MTPLSPRYAPAAAVLLLVCAVPVWLHAALAPVQDPCADPEAILQASRIGGVDRNEEAPLSRGVSFQGRIQLGDRLLWGRVLRSPAPFDLSWNPAPGFEMLLPLRAEELRRIRSADDTLPVHWISRVTPRSGRVEAYLYVQGGRPVEHPLWSGLAQALPQLLHGTRPFTVLVVSGVSARQNLAELERDAERWLAAAWRDLESACGDR